MLEEIKRVEVYASSKRPGWTPGYTGVDISKVTESDIAKLSEARHDRIREACKLLQCCPPLDDKGVSPTHIERFEKMSQREETWTEDFGATYHVILGHGRRHAWPPAHR